jgi:hypothetical protein
MSVRTWWPLFPLLFLIVISSLTAALLRLRRYGNGTWVEWSLLQGALISYFLTFLFGRWRWIHRPMSNIAELFILIGTVYFYRAGKRPISYLNGTALAAIGFDFALHILLR